MQPLTESISGGYNGALLICGGASLENLTPLIDHSMIKQFYPDGSAVDLLSPNRETLKRVAHPVLGRCSSLFSVAVEWKLHPEEVESEVCRSRLQLFSLAGGASRTDLRGVSPLVKVVEETQSEATTSDKILPSLLNDALTGNSRTASVNCWCPRATEQMIRDTIVDQRAVMMSQGENDVHNTIRLAELTQNLQIVKDQSWEKRREESKKIKDKTQSCRTPSSHLHSRDSRESTNNMKHLQTQLKQEMEKHIREGKGNVEKVQERVARIQQLREALREETLKDGASAEKSDLYQQSELEYSKAQERRTQLKEDHGRLIQAELEKMERDLAQEQLSTEGPQRELLVLSGERRVLVLQMEALRDEAQQAETDLQNLYQKHQTELHCLREESLQVFRVFRQVCEEQRRMSEDRYRSVLLEAVQDAVYLSAQNQQLQADNRQLRKALGELKDTLAVRAASPIIETGRRKKGVSCSPNMAQDSRAFTSMEQEMTNSLVIPLPCFSTTDMRSPLAACPTIITQTTPEYPSRKLFSPVIKEKEES
ncbi:hypothetical protein F7725_010021, partial [Dissostichus mawsoni]